jgi:hypothetical protein
MFLISGLRRPPVSIFQIDLAENKRLIELRYEMDIVNFNLLFILQIDSSYMKLKPSL